MARESIASMNKLVTILFLGSVLVSSCHSTSEAFGKLATATPVPELAATPPKTEDTGQAIIPIPSGVDYKGIGSLLRDGYADITFFASKDVYPTASGATSLGALLGQYGWVYCSGEPGCESVEVTDTAFRGIYRHGTSESSPTVAVGVNMMVTPEEWTILFVKNCSEIKEVRVGVRSSADCVILVLDGTEMPEENP